MDEIGAAMTDDELRQAVKNILMTIPTGDSGNYFHDDLVQVLVQAFKQQQAVGVRMAKMANRRWINGTLQTEKASFIDWCEAKAKELET